MNLIVPQMFFGRFAPLSSIRSSMIVPVGRDVP
jgi:hypothetical protein